jgi:hypothetical protein
MANIGDDGANIENEAYPLIVTYPSQSPSWAKIFYWSSHPPLPGKSLAEPI